MTSSPYLPNNELLVHHRDYHGIICSGMLPTHYTRFSKTANIGCLTKEKRTCMSPSYNASVQEVYNESVDSALLQEVASYEDLSDGIEIMTDARHGWRNNAKDSSIVAIGEKTHKVLQCINVTERDDPVSQRHEKVGTENTTVTMVCENSVKRL